MTGSSVPATPTPLTGTSRPPPSSTQALYEAAAAHAGTGTFPARVGDLNPAHRLQLRAALRARSWPPAALVPYAELCHYVSNQTAALWSARVDTPARAETLLWRLLRIMSAPYFILGSDPRQPLRLRIDTPWDWRQRYKLRRLAITADPAGQPQVAWKAEVTKTASGHIKTVHGHIEIRWSHGRFAQTPEAGVYLDTPHHHVPGYVHL